MNRYLLMKEQHQKEINAFPIYFAFSDKQFVEGMRKLGLDPSDTDKIYAFGGTGGFYRRSDVDELEHMMIRHCQEMQDAIASDTIGDKFVFDMFQAELSNHEYNYTGDISDTLEALALTYDEIQANPVLKKALKQAIAAYTKNDKL